MTVLKFEDHLLRRFGMAEYLVATEYQTPALRLQSAADEIWALLEGKVEFRWHDLRQGSPSRGKRVRVFSASPTLVLVPFGVAFGFRVPSGKASLLRLATHSDVEGPPAQLLPWEGGG
jgi:dTDP-4-dehydrorhamnose 3,5-epimerase